MSKQNSWDKYECALLIEACRKVNDGAQKQKVAEELSKSLRQRAKQQGHNIDAFFRNYAGIILQMSKMEYLLTNGKKGLFGAGKNFFDMVQLKNSNSKEFVSILLEAKKQINYNAEGDLNVGEFMSPTSADIECKSYLASGETAIIHKLVDKSLLVAGLTVPKAVSSELMQKLGISLVKGENCEITVFINKSSYQAKIISVNFSEKYSDVEMLQIRYTTSSPLCKRINKMFEDDFKNGVKAYLDIYVVGERQLEFVSLNNSDFTVAVNDCRNLTAPKKAAYDSFSEQIKSVLKKHYQYGFRLESVIDIKRFRRYAEEDNIKIPDSDDDLKSGIKNAGIKIEDKVYLIEEDTFAFIRKTINMLTSNGSKILFYDCIYDSDPSGMEEQYITSAEQLKEILKQCTQSIFEKLSGIYFAKNFVSLLGEKAEKDAVTIEIQRIWDNRQTRRVDELVKQLPSIPEEYVRRYLSGNTAFVWISEGVYFNMQRFVISEEEKKAILSFVAEECDNKGYASISDVPFGNIEEENYELSTVGLQEAVYNSVLLNQYYLNGKILTRDNKALDVVTLAKQYLVGKDECTFDEMDKKVEEIAGTRYRYMAYDALYGTMIRVDKNRYVAHQYLKFDVDAIDEILSEMIKNKFLAIKEITSFALFPVCGFPWNHYLLESYCYSYSKRFCLKVVGFNDKNAGIIAENDVTDGYYELLAQAAARAKIELNAEAVGQYYFETGYMGKRRFSDLESTVERAKAIREEL